jgi:AraC-like DNA-binding protein
MMEELLAELARLIACHCQPGVARIPALPGLTLSVISAPSALDGHIAGPQIVLVAQGEKLLAFGDRALRYGPGQYIIISLDIPLVASVTRADPTKPYIGMCLALKSEVIGSLLLETRGVLSTPGDRQSPSVNQVRAELIEPIIRYLRLLDRPVDIPVLAPAIEREIIWRLIMGDQGDVIRQMCLPDSRLAQVSRAARWIRDHYAATFRIEDLAGVAGMSVSSLHRHFLAVTSLTPIQYQKHVRLNIARNRFIGGEQDVANIAYSVGYNSPSQFSREYRRLFGCPPSADTLPAQDGDT